MDAVRVSANIVIPAEEIELSAIRSQGPGGQHVNKVASGIHLRFDIANSSLPEAVKQRLLDLADHRISRDGILVIKAQQGRSQARNRIVALETLADLVRSALKEPKKRKATKPTGSSVTRRLDRKKLRSAVKQLRRKIDS